MHTATSSRWRAAVVELRAGIAWGLVVLGITLAILVLGAIVLPAQADETPARVPSAQAHGEPDSEMVPGETAGNIALPGDFQ